MRLLLFTDSDSHAGRFDLRFQVVAIVGALLAGCVDEGPDHPGPTARARMDDAAVMTDAGDLLDGTLDDASFEPEPPPGAQYVMLNDTTMGISPSLYFGSDLDAVTYACPDGRQGAGVAISGERQGNALELPTEGGVGLPDAPCEPLEDCAATAGPGGWLGVQLQSGSLSGCTVTVHEAADSPEDRFEVWLCPTATLNGTCNGPLFFGTDGESAEGVMP